MGEFEREVREATRTAVHRGLIEAAQGHGPSADEIADAVAERVVAAVEGQRRGRRATKWDQRAIVEWSDATFGEPSSNLSIAVRANEEMAELLRCLTGDDLSQEARLEVADIVIILCRLTDRLGGTVVGDVGRKMEINVGRTWRRRGDGHGQHVRENSDDVTLANASNEQLLSELRLRGLPSVSEF